MGYYVDFQQMDRILGQLRAKYRVFAPKRFAGRGWGPGRDLIRYGEISTISELVHDEKSDFSPKEVLHPVLQTMFFFKGDECVESDSDGRSIILFARPCDINGIAKLDTLFLENGGIEDFYYKRLREKIKIFMLECTDGWDTCFCASMGSNRAEDYSVALRFGAEHLYAHVKDEAFGEYFSGAQTADFVPEFIESNLKSVELPGIDAENLKKARSLDMWKSFDDKCISCGSCNTVCVTCGCFDTSDVIYDEMSKDGERRRVWSGCMLEDFTSMAGGHRVRASAGERMRFKTLHKVYDFNARFKKGNMCVGCGRCDNRCPEKISFSDTINQLSSEMR